MKLAVHRAESARRRGLHLGVAAILLAGGSFVACAESDASPPVNDPPPPQPIPPPNDDGGLDAGNADGACAEADGCSAMTPDCTTADFCTVPFPVSRQVSLNAVWGSGPDDIWAVGTHGTILHGNQSGFSPVPTDTDTIFFAVWGTSKNDVWTVAAGAPLHSNGFEGGPATFKPQGADSWSANGGRRIWAGVSTSTKGVWVAGDYTQSYPTPGSFWRLGENDAGASTWNIAPSCPAGQFCQSSARGLWAADANDVWAVGPGGQAYRLDDVATGHWTQLDTSTSNDLFAVWGSGPNDVWAVGAGGVIRHITKTTGRWDVIASPTIRTLYAIWGSGPNDIWAAGDAGTLIHYDGQSWSLGTIGLTSSETPSALLGVWGSGPDDVWAVGEGLILHRTKTSRRQP